MARPKAASKAHVKSGPSKAGVRKTAKAPSVETVNPIADRALKKRWEKAIARYRNALTDATEGWDARYEALDEILSSDPPYYLAAGYKDAVSFLKAEAPAEDPRTVRCYIRVARHFSPQDEANHGVSKLDLLVTYLEAKNGKPLKGPIDPEAHRIPVPEGEGHRDIPFSQITVAQLRRVVRELSGIVEKTSASEPPLVKRIRAVLAKAGLATVGVSMRQGHVALSGIDPKSLAALGKAISQLGKLEGR